MKAGAAYVFTRSGVTWTQHSKLVMTNGSDYDQFGISVSISDDGSVCAIGGYHDSDKGERSGSVAIFKKNGGVWEQTSKLLASDGAEGDQFGNSVSLSGDGKTCVIGAYFDDNRLGVSAGAAYVFV
jgi:hypothetical protein